MPYYNTKQEGEWAQIEFPHPGFIPSKPIIWPDPGQRRNQVQQTKISAKPFQTAVQPTTQPNQATVTPRTTPQMVSNVRVVTRAAVNGQKTVIVQFTHPGNDPYFAGARVYIRQAGQNKQPSLVAGGGASPLTFTVPVNQAPHVLHVTSYGQWGETPVTQSPAKPVRLV
jgi:hypothetical protein